MSGIKIVSGRKKNVSGKKNAQKSASPSEKQDENEDFSKGERERDDEAFAADAASFVEEEQEDQEEDDKEMEIPLDEKQEDQEDDEAKEFRHAIENRHVNFTRASPPAEELRRASSAIGKKNYVAGMKQGAVGKSCLYQAIIVWTMAQ